MPRFQRRRNAVTISSVSMCTSEVDLTSSIDNSNNTAVSALQVLSDDSRAVSCSDLLLEFGEKKKNVSGFYIICISILGLVISVNRMAHQCSALLHYTTFC